MTGIKQISPRKEPRQKRSKELRRSILEAATYILKHEGPGKFTTNGIAERAGVNIASFYQYYPNKESLLFHLIELQWAETYGAAFPILKDEKLSHRDRLHLFIKKFFAMEAQDRDVKDAIAHLGYLVEHTKEYRDLLIKGQDDFSGFLASQEKSSSKKECSRNAEFILHAITSFSECKTTGRWLRVKCDSQIMAEMICSHFEIES